MKEVKIKFERDSAVGSCRVPSFFLMALLILPGATSVPAQAQRQAKSLADRRLFNEANRKLNASDFNGAKILLSRFIIYQPNSSEAHNLLGVCLLALGDASKAEQSFRRAIDLNPKYTSALLNLASVLLARQNEAEGVSLIKKAARNEPAILEQHPKSFFLHHMIGRNHARRGEFALAVRHLSQAYKLSPDSVTLGLALIDVYLRQGAFDEAEKLITKWQSKLTDEQLRVIAKFWLDVGRSTKAVSLMTRSPVLAAQLYQAALEKAKEEFALKKPASAAEILEAVKTLKPSADATYHELLGSVYYELDDPKKAADEFQEALRLVPSNETLYLKLGMVFLKHRTPQPALFTFEHALKHRPQSALLWMGMGLSQSMGENFEEAEKSLRRAIALDPKFTDPYVILGDVLEKTGKRDEALSIFADLIETHPDLYASYYYYGRLAVGMAERDVDKIIEVLQTAVRLNPNFAEGFYELGRAFERAGKLDEAIAAFKKSLDVNPRIFSNHYRLSLLYKKLGNGAQANLELKAFQEGQKRGDSETTIKRLEYQLSKP